MKIKVPTLKHIPKGFHTYTAFCGMKNKKLDLGIVHADKPCLATAMFTRNKVIGEPLKIGKKHITNHYIQTLVVNSKNANVLTGKEGYQNSLLVCNQVASELNISINHVFPSSTGVIGFPLPVEKIIPKLKNLSENFHKKPSFEKFATAIMTTDIQPKYLSYKVGDATLLGVAKGSGMVEPNMATTLIYFFTDAIIPLKKLKSCFKTSINKSFNSLSIDSDMSTSDTALILSNRYYDVDYLAFQNTLENICTQLAKWIIADGEGVTQIFTVNVIHAKSNKDAYHIGKSIINSPLVKTGFSPLRPNPGRLFMAIGKTNNVKINPDKIQIFFGEKKIPYTNYEKLKKYLQKESHISITIDLGLGKKSWTVYGCNLTQDYIKINSHYIS